jgi:protein-tyrosine phosphatase
MGEIEMIDLHAHILPDLDDGAETVEEALEMCRVSYKDGTKTMVATPHILPGIYENDRSTILSKLHELNEALIHSELSLVVLPGADVHFSLDMLQLCENGEIVTVNDNGRYLMVEFDFQGIPYHAEDVLFQMIMHGIIPIITHPERNLEIARSPNRYYEIIKMGCLGQVTAMSLTGGFGPAVKKVAGKLLTKRLLHIIASDAHSIDRRPPILSTALRATEKMVGKEEARKMVTEYPQAIIEGRKPNVPDPSPI